MRTIIDSGDLPVMMICWSRSGRPSEVSPRNWVLVEGPSIGDANFTIAWLMAAVEADKALQAYFQEHPRFRERLRRIEIFSLIEFAPCGMAFVRMWRIYPLTPSIG